MMSKYKIIVTELDNAAHLRTALGHVAEIFSLRFEEHPEPVHLLGFQGDTRPETAHFLIRRGYLGRASNDLGWLIGPDGKISLILSDYDARQARVRDICKELKREYAAAETIARAETEGYICVSERDKSGVVQQIRLRRYQ